MLFANGAASVLSKANLAIARSLLRCSAAAQRRMVTTIAIEMQRLIDTVLLQSMILLIGGLVGGPRSVEY